MTRISQTSIDNFLYNVSASLYKYGVSQAYRDIAPLSWYIGTNRASMDFLHALINSDAEAIAERLHAGGSYDVAIKRVKRYLKTQQKT